MIRADLIVNAAVFEDLLENLQASDLADHYTVYNSVHGKGRSGSRFGTPVWPEENVHILIMMDQEKTQALQSVFSNLKAQFPKAGMKCYLTGNVTENV